MDLKKGVFGALFILTSAVLISAQYITAAILGVGRNEWSSGAIYHVFSSAGYVLISLSVITFIIGLLIIISGIRKNN